MRKMAFILMLAFVLLITFDSTACAEEVSVSAQAYALYCVENEQLITGKNYDDKLKMASTTKIMTTLLALEQAAIDDTVVTFTQDMVTEGSSMYLKVGDRLHLSDLASGMMMCSGNDAANATAVSMAGSLSGFAELMNQKARHIGMTNTNFVTPSGLDDDAHYSTAFDMAKLMAYALENDDFRELTCSKSKTVDFLIPKTSVTYYNHNRLLSMYEYCIGGKTGYTEAAGRCLVSAAQKDSVTLVCVTLNAPSDWHDHMALYDYGFDALCAVKPEGSTMDYTVDVVGGTKDTLDLYVKDSPDIVVDRGLEDSVETNVYIPAFVYAPVKKGTQLGMINYELNGDVIAQTPLYASQGIILNKKNNLFDKILNLLGSFG